MSNRRGPISEWIRLVSSASPLPDRIAARIDAEAWAVEYPAGTVLFEDDTPCAGLWIAERGVVCVRLTNASGRSLVLYRVGPGETCVLTLGCLLGRERIPARGEAESDVRGVVLPRDLFTWLVGELPAFRAFVFESFARRLREALAVTSAVAFERLEGRLATHLLARIDREISLDIAVTHQQLADELGCTREAASRLLEGLESSRVVSLGRGHVRIVDKHALTRLVSAPS